jgi:hypothetical protein
MFSADGKYIIKENYENDIKKINKNSQLFYDAEGALRASIMISEYGDFTVSTNYGAVKQNLSFNSDGTLRTTGGRICLEDVCLNKDDILKLKQMKVSGENTSVAATAAATAAANKSEALEAAKKEAVNQALENKGVIDIKVKQMEDAKVVADQTVTKALTAQTNTKSLVDTAQIQKKAADKEVEDAVAVVQNATVALNDANDVGDTDEITSSQNAKNAAEDSLVSYQDSQTNAQTALDTAKSEKNAADTNVRSAITKQTEVGSNLVKVKVEQTNASDAIKTLTE